MGWDWRQAQAERRPYHPKFPAVIEHALAAAVKIPTESLTCWTSLAEGGCGSRCLTTAGDGRIGRAAADGHLPGGRIRPRVHLGAAAADWLGRPLSRVVAAQSKRRPTPPAAWRRCSRSRHAAHRGPSRRTGPADADRTRIALNPGAQASVPIFPEGVGYLAANLVSRTHQSAWAVRLPIRSCSSARFRAFLAAIPDVRKPRGPGYRSRPGEVLSSRSRWPTRQLNRCATRSSTRSSGGCATCLIKASPST